MAAQMRAYRARNLERMREYERARARRPEVIVAKREDRLRLLYGISLEEYADRVQRQGGTCAICKKAPNVRTIRGVVQPVFVVDHDHVTGRVRGLLCDRCNFTLGRFEDDPLRFEAAATYLRGVR